MHYTPKPKLIQIELSNVCNSECPGCSRYIRDLDKATEVFKRDGAINIHNIPIKLRDESPPTHIELDLIKQLLQSEACSELEDFQFVGTIDDPFAYKHLLELVNYIVKRHPHLILAMHTNGSIRTPEFYIELANLLNQLNNPPIVWFGIDGLRDTNHIYRRRCNWDKIMENAKAFIGAGGKAAWQFIEFPWNMHQIDKARELAQKMGFASFRSRKDTSDVTDAHLNRWPKITLADTQRKNSLRLLDPELVPVDQNNPIRCHWGDNKQYHIEYTGKVWPCCFFNSSRAKYTTQEIHEKPFEIYGDGWNNLNYHSFDEILQHRFYTEDLTDSWQSLQHGYGYKDRILRCSVTCSADCKRYGINSIKHTDFKKG